MNPINLKVPAVSSLLSDATGPQTGIGFLAQPGPRNQFFIQNVGTNPIFVALTGEASPTNYHLILSGGDAGEDGNGASWSAHNWCGQVSVSGSSINYTYFEF
jgi:hypothetical protein